MSILTKICVVLLVVASLVAAVVFTSLATVAPNWKFSYLQEKDAFKNLEVTTQAHMEQVNRLRNELQEVSKAKSTTETDLISKYDKLAAEYSAVKIENADLQKNMTAIASNFKNVEIKLDAMEKTSQSQQKALKESWERERTYQSQNIQMSDSLKEMEGKNARLNQTVRYLQEQMESMRQSLAEKDKQIVEFKKGGAVAKVDTEEVTVSVPKVTGTITAVNNNLASINLGSVNGLKQGAKLIIYRGDQFVGHLKIEKVDSNESAGIIMDMRLTPKQGDKVTSDLSS